MESKHRSRAIIFAVCLSFVLFTSAAASAAPEKPSSARKNCLWLVQTPSIDIFLLGSLHVLKSDAYPLATPIEKAYRSSQKIIFETDLGAMQDPAVQAKMLTLGLYPEGQTLFRQISEGTRQALEKRMADLGLPMEPFVRFKPWFIALTLTTLELQRLGFNPVYGIDIHFYDRARSDEKEIGFLEPVEDQLKLLAEMDASDQEAFLGQTLRDLDLAAGMADDLVASWKRGDAQKLYRLLFKSFEGYPAIKDRLLIQRNRDWVLKIEAMMVDRKSFLVIVGAGHLIGPDSVVELLKQKGYRVTQR